MVITSILGAFLSETLSGTLLLLPAGITVFLEKSSNFILIIPLWVYIILLSGIVIDLVTLIIVSSYKGVKSLYYYVRKIKIQEPETKFKISVVIPAYNEENNIERAVESAFNQTLKPGRVIVIDDNSKDKTVEICRKLQKKYKNLKIVAQKENHGKAYNISYILKNTKLDEIVIVLDADTFLSENYIEEIIKPFNDQRVAIVTGSSLPVKSKNFQGKIIYYGSNFQHSFFCFRKIAQSYRNAVSVVCGDSAAYRTSFLKQIGGFPQGTQTEDMDLTWITLEQGKKIVFQKNAHALSQDPDTFKGHWKQISRWYNGAFQCIFKHNFKLLKAKSLLFTTILPNYIDSVIYSFMFLFSLFQLYNNTLVGVSFYTTDFIFTLIAVYYLDLWNLIRLPQIYIIKFVWSAAWLVSGLKTTGQFIMGKRDWSGKWDRSSFYARKNKK